MSPGWGTATTCHGVQHPVPVKLLRAPEIPKGLNHANVIHYAVGFELSSGSTSCSGLQTTHGRVTEQSQPSRRRCPVEVCSVRKMNYRVCMCMYCVLGAGGDEGRKVKCGQEEWRMSYRDGLLYGATYQSRITGLCIRPREGPCVTRSR